MEKVLVLMNTYNGSAYLGEQLDSILSQEEVETHLFIRDDGSTDNTISILNGYKKRYPDRFTILIGEKNLGPSGSNRVVVEKCPLTFDYFAFSDQDDFWLPNKLRVALSHLKELEDEKPRLYYSNLSITDAQLNIKFMAYKEGQVTDSYNGCLPDFYASCNTFVCDKKAILLFREAEPKLYYHGDIWYQVLCYFLGNVFYDKDSYILFRRTGSNASGPREKGRKLFYTRSLRFFDLLKSKRTENDTMRQCMATDILDRYGDQLPEDKIHVLKAVSKYQESFLNKLKLILDPRVKSCTLSRNFHMAVRVLFNAF